MIAILLVSAVAAKIVLDKNMMLSLADGVVKPFFTVDPNDSSKGQSASMILDLTHPGIYVSNLVFNTYGIDCNFLYQCKATGRIDVCSYRQLELPCEDAATLLRFKQGKLAEKSPAQLSFSLFNSTQEWSEDIGNYGLLGISPKSFFWKYLATAYSLQEGQRFLEMSVSYAEDDPLFMVNGRAGINEPITQRYKYDNGLWIFDNLAVDFKVPGLSATSMSVCVDNTADSFLLTADAPAIRSKILSKLCGGISKCTRDNSNLDRLSPITVTFKGDDGKSISADLPVSEYIWFDSSNIAQVRVDDIDLSPGCKSQRNAVGKRLLSKVEFVILMHQDEGVYFEVGFNEIVYENNMAYIIILAALGAGLLVLICIITGINMYRKRQAEDYSQENN